VARAARQPVLLAGRTFVPLCRIVLAYEGSPHARAAMRHAVGLAADLTLPLVVLSIHKQAPEYLAQVAHYAADYGVALSTLALRGDPTTALVSALTEGDLLAMGAFGQGRVREWLLGSTTEAMLRLSPQPILLCHLP
jgi:nucleotide-binding universal stress UspA family protein